MPSSLAVVCGWSALPSVRVRHELCGTGASVHRFRSARRCLLFAASSTLIFPPTLRCSLVVSQRPSGSALGLISRRDLVFVCLGDGSLSKRGEGACSRLRRRVDAKPTMGDGGNMAPAISCDLTTVLCRPCGGIVQQCPRQGARPDGPNDAPRQCQQLELCAAQ